MAALQFADGTVVGNRYCGVILTRGHGRRAAMTLCGRPTVRVQHDEHAHWDELVDQLEEHATA